MIELQIQEEQNQLTATSLTIQEMSEMSLENLFEILKQKQQTIQNLLKQITKSKAEQMKTKKLIQSLQSKVEKLTPSLANTGSRFMMPSEFKSLFENFMTNTVPNILGEFIEMPSRYCKVFKTVMKLIYEQLHHQIQMKTYQVLLGLGLGKDSKQEMLHMILPFLQNNYKQVFRPRSDLSQCLRIRNCQEIEQLENLQNSQDLQTFLQQSFEICIYMLLQSFPWEFIFNNNSEQENKKSYEKKNDVCIDGFAKEGREMVYILKGIKTMKEEKEHFHPNLKNFVIPNTQESEPQLSLQEFSIEINLFEQNDEKEDIKCLSKSVEVQLEQEGVKAESEQEGVQDFDRKDKAYQLILQEHLNRQISKSSILLKSNPYTRYSNMLKKPAKINEIFEAPTAKSEMIESLVMGIQGKNSRNHNGESVNKQQNNLKGSQIDSKTEGDQHHPEKAFEKKKNNREKSHQKNVKKEKHCSVIDIGSQKKPKRIKRIEKNKQNINPGQLLEGFVDLKREQSNLPLNKELKAKVKKSINDPKTNGRSSRKCSIGKIVNQGSEFLGGKTSYGTKSAVISQSSTIAVKDYQSNCRHTQSVRRQATKGDSDIAVEKRVSKKLSGLKNGREDRKRHDLDGMTVIKEERPLKMYHENMVGRLRDKYLAS